MIHVVQQGDRIRRLSVRYGVPVGTIVNDNAALLGWKAEDTNGAKLVPSGSPQRGISLEALPIIKPGDRLAIAEVVREQPAAESDGSTLVYGTGLLILAAVLLLKMRGRKKKR